MKKSENLELYIKELKTKGFVIIPPSNDFCKHKVLKEVELLMKEEKDKKNISGGDCIYPLLLNKVFSVNYPNLNKLLTSPLLAKIGKAYFNLEGIPKVRFGSFVYGEYIEDKSIDGNHHAHWDPTLELRLMVYLEETNESNGAIKIVPETHYMNHEKRLKNWTKEYITFNAITNEGEHQFISINGEAGTVIIFDTGVSHKRGLISKGKHRKVLFSFIRSKLANLYYTKQPLPNRENILWPHK